MRRVWKGTGFVLCVCVVCSWLSCLVPFDALLTLGFGWLFHLQRVLPRAEFHPWRVVAGLAGFGVFAVGLHAFLKWFHAGTTQRCWAPHWSGVIVAGLAILDFAGVAASGVAYQVAGLAMMPGPRIHVPRHGGRRAWSSSHLRQIGLGAIQYADRHNLRAPVATADQDGLLLHGWMTRLLPYLDEQEVYNQVNFEVPWDHQSNGHNFGIVIICFTNSEYEMRSPGGFALTHYSGNVHLLGGTAPRTMLSVQEGSGTTILMGEIADGLPPWGYPANWRDPALGINRSPRRGFGGPYPGGANFVFADGSIRFISDRVDPRIMEALGTPGGAKGLNPSHLLDDLDQP
jgi:prepilin-type processing-associated H-X9-DG protein